MIDPKLFRTDLEDIAKRLSQRGYILDIDRMNSLEEQRKILQMENPTITK